MNNAYRRKSQLAAGVALICVFFLIETFNADRITPNPASPYIWTVLGLVAAAASGLAVWFRYRANER